MGDEGGRVPERVEAMEGREAQQEDNKTAERSFGAVGFRVIKTDRETDRNGGGAEAGITRMRGDLLKCSLSCDLSTDARQEAQETVPSDRVTTLHTDE